MMNENKIRWYGNKYSALFITLSLLTLFAFFLASGCAKEAPVVNEAPQKTDEESTPASTEAPVGESVYPRTDHSLDANPDSLPLEETTLSLQGYGAIGALSDGDLTLLDMLTYAVEDEYLAHGEYMEIIDRFDVERPYGNIARSEEMHLSFLSEVYGSYGIPFPEDTSSDHLIIPESLLEAAQTGVQAEIDNIAMYKNFMTYDLPENVLHVFDALKRWSESHLMAFEKQVDRLK